MNFNHKYLLWVRLTSAQTNLTNTLINVRWHYRVGLILMDSSCHPDRDKVFVKCVCVYNITDFSRSDEKVEEKK